MKKIIIILVSCFGLASCEEMELSVMDDVQSKSDTIQAAKAFLNDTVKKDSLTNTIAIDMAEISNR